jgi:hypothetical protein
MVLRTYSLFIYLFILIKHIGLAWATSLGPFHIFPIFRVFAQAWPLSYNWDTNVKMFIVRGD